MISSADLVPSQNRESPGEPSSFFQVFAEANKEGDQNPVTS